MRPPSRIIAPNILVAVPLCPTIVLRRELVSTESVHRCFHPTRLLPRRLQREALRPAVAKPELTGIVLEVLFTAQRSFHVCDLLNRK